MPHFVGLDVSQSTTAICVVDEKGERVRDHSIVDFEYDPQSASLRKIGQSH